MIQKSFCHDSTAESSNSFQSNEVTNSSLNYDYFLSSASKNRTSLFSRKYTKIFRTPFDPEKINLSLGLPAAETFPFGHIDVFLKDGSSFSISGNPLNYSLNYLPDTSYLRLVDWLKKLQEKIHGPQSWSSIDLTVCNSTEEGLAIIIAMILDQGDSVIVQSPTYPGILDLLIPIGAKIIELQLDNQGIDVNQLEHSLERIMKSGKPLPKLMYLNPIGANPTGLTITNEEKKEIYRLACKYNFLIMEDDPYYFIRFSKENMASFFSLDIENRVIRFDSFSKLVTGGLFLDFITGPKVLIDKIKSTIHDSKHLPIFVLVMMNQILEQWKYEGFMRFTDDLRFLYENRRDAMLHAAEKYLKDVADWSTPLGGFFLWLRLKHVKDVTNIVMKANLENSILVTPGHLFYVDIRKPSPHLRLSFSIIPLIDVDSVVSKLAVLIHEEMSKVLD